MEYPCYADEIGNIYFDLNNGNGKLDLYTGAYRHIGDNSICGEPYAKLEELAECIAPFVRHERQYDYMMLGRLQSDCNYFLGCGNGCEGHLYYKDVNKHCDEMKKLYESFAEDEKPEWLTLEQIEKYRENMLKLLKEKENPFPFVPSGYAAGERYYYDDDGNEYYIGKDKKRHYTRDEG